MHGLEEHFFQLFAKKKKKLDVLPDVSCDTL
jgi:hypothetical protein